MENTDTKQLFISFTAAVLLSACAGIPKPSISELAATEASPTLIRLQPDGSIKDSVERSDTQDLIDATYSVIESPEFMRNLRELDGKLKDLWLSPYGETVPAKEVFLAYLGRDKNHMPVPSTLKWGKTERTVPAEGTAAAALIELSLSKLAQWRSSSITHKSCAINTLAHELTHTVSRDNKQFRYLFTDGGRRWATFLGRPLVSYTVGAVAQCTYLQQHGDVLGTDLRACIERWGTNQFYSSGCAPESE